MENEKIIMGNDGKNRFHVLVVCKTCGKDFYKPKRFIKKSTNHFCSRKCHFKYSSDINSFFTKCDYCNKEIKRRNSKRNVSKSGLFFCSRKCKDIAQRFHGNENAEKFKDMMPSHFGVGKNTHFPYRRLALEHYGNKCRVCGYGIEEVLQVHHKDCDRSNNSLENLDVLCPTHHWEYHMGVRKY